MISVSAAFYYYTSLQAIITIIFIFWLHSNEASQVLGKVNDIPMRRQHLLSTNWSVFCYKSWGFCWKCLDITRVIQIPAGGGMRSSQKTARTLKLALISILVGNGLYYVLGGFMIHLLQQGLPVFHLLCRRHLESQKGSGHVSHRQD